ncbi:MAG: selenocysteine-specific translation elongation factor [Vulcanimicrobiaceae bacterium]
MHIIGTAGHVDHGKSSLVRALTGTDPDRWIEEQLRGMTLDLGFAHLRFPDGVEAGIVDVPGHERFLHNMLAGAAGMELLLLVIAANEGPKPQTIEHLSILQYLNVKRTIVVLTKSDTVDAEELAFAEELVREALAGTIADGAPYVAVSTITGAGMDALRAEIHAALVALPLRAPGAPAYLPIDRVFALPGHGTIVTGTLVQGAIAVGDQLNLAPLARDVRVRSVQVFGEKRDAVAGGSRVAINLPGIETHEISRGAVLASPQFVTRANVDVRFRALPAAVAILKRRTPVRAYVGSAEIIGTLVFATLPTDASEVAAKLFLREETVVFPGAAFVVRRLSPKTLLGGGTIAGVDGSYAGAEHDDDPSVAAVVAALHEAGLAGATATRVGASANVREDVAETILARLVEDGRAIRLAKPVAYVDAELARALVATVRERLAASEAAAPWTVGMTLLGLSRLVAVAEPTLVRVLAAAVEDGSIAFRGGYYASPAFVPQLSAEQRSFFDRTFVADTGGALAPVPFAELSTALRASKIVGIAQAFETLLTSGALVKVHDAVYRGVQLAEVRGKLEAALRRDKQITMAGFRDLVGTSRKFAVPLLEWFDATGVTIRSGDIRLLRIVPPPRS